MQRCVYYLADANDALSSLDGSRVSRFRATVESFLNEPHSTFSKRLSSNIRQVKHRGSKTRAFGTWCRDETREVLVVHVIYRKRNEASFFEHLDDYDEEGRQFKNRFRELDDEKFEAWRQSARTSSEVLLVES